MSARRFRFVHGAVAGGACGAGIAFTEAARDTGTSLFWLAAFWCGVAATYALRAAFRETVTL